MQVLVYLSTETGQEELMLAGNTFMQGHVYMLQASACRPGYMDGLAQILIVTNLPPYGGSCNIAPKEGETIFLPLYYKYPSV